MENAEGWRGSKWPASSICSSLPLLCARDCCCKSSVLVDRKTNAGSAPAQGSEMSPILQWHGCTPRPHTPYFICARALEAQSQAAGNSKPRGLIGWQQKQILNNKNPKLTGGKKEHFNCGLHSAGAPHPHTAGEKSERRGKKVLKPKIRAASNSNWGGQV